jgi:hypothetical protein
MSTRHYVDGNGAYLGGYGAGALPAGEAFAVAEAPADARQIWDGNAWSWPVEILRNEKMRALEARYAAALAAGLPYGGKLLQIREADQQNIAAMGQEARWVLAIGASWPPGFAWRMADNSFLPLADAAAMVALGEAAKAEVYRLRQVKWTHADAIAGAMDAAALAAINLDNGW